jgi:hypothetical protein
MAELLQEMFNGGCPFFLLNSIYELNVCLQHHGRQRAPLLSETVDLHNTPNKILNTKFSKGY